MVLIAVLVVVVLLSLAAYQYSEFTLSEYRAADQAVRSAQAKMLADSGVNYTAALLADPATFGTTIGGTPYDNASVFQGMGVREDEQPRWSGRFSVVSPPGPDEAGVPFRYGVTDESGKINLNALARLDTSGDVLFGVLMRLPNMTEDIANAVVDWIDADEEPRPNGAENTYYGALEPPLRCKNGPLDTLEELLLVRGVTPQLLFGNDRNRNGVTDPDEDDGTGNVLGWSSFLTVYSRELNVDAANQPRVYLNGSDPATLQTELTTAVGTELAGFIMAYRMYGAFSRNSARGQVVNGTLGQLSTELSRATGSGGRQRLNSLSSVYELIGASVGIPSADGQTTTVYQSPLTDQGQLRTNLPKLLDKTTTRRDAELPACVNVNTAPQAVLACLPGLSESDIQAIIARRPALTAVDPADESFSTPAWLVTEANLRPQVAQALERYVTARGRVYRFQSVGFFEQGGPAARVEAVIDATDGTPRVVYRRDLTELGRGFDVAAQP